MLKNSTKLTSLVVAAATIASMTPAFAATTSLEEKDGTVYKAVAYKDGKFYIDGEVEDKDNSVYFLDNGKYTELEDLDNGSDAKLYGSKYVNVDDGDAYVDLSNGKVNDDDDLKEDDADDAKTAVSKKIKKDSPDDRYELDTDDKPAFKADFEEKFSGDSEIGVVTSPYMDNYYEYKVKNQDGGFNTIYSDKDGKYVDADYDLGKIKIVVAGQDDLGEAGVHTSSDAAGLRCDDKGLTSIRTTGDAVEFGKKEAVTIENTNDLAKTSDKVWAFKVRISDSETIGQDKDYIYRTVNLHFDLYKKSTSNKYVIYATDIQKDNDLAFGGVNDIVKVAADANGIKVLQKISKEQNSDEIDDAKYPKTTNTYFFNEYKDFAAKKNKDYADRLAEARVDLTSEADGAVDEWKENEALGGWSFANGKVNNYRFNGDNFKAQTFTLKEKAGFYYLDKEDGDFDVDDDEEYSATVDIDGNIWILDNGKIKQYNNNGGFDTVYKCDGAMDAISVYDKDNVIVWNEDEDEFAILGGKSTTGKEDTEETTTTAQAGWVQNADSTWSYINADGTKAIGWLQSPASGLWYHMDANGIMEAGKWLQDAGSWYYLNADGSMKTGWLYNGGAWYYLKPSAGNMGAMQTGWIQSGGKWYYCNASGAMLSNTTVNGYVLGADGAWIK